MQRFPSHLPSPLHQCLREASKQAHRRLDHHALLVPLLKPDLSERQYGNALLGLQGIQTSAEALIHAFFEQHPELCGYRPRQRLPALLADLTALGRACVAPSLSLPAPDTMGEMVGMLYTLEGSNRGAQVIARTIRGHGHGHLPLQFFDVEGNAAQRDWLAFWNFAQLACRASDYDLAGAAAANIFELIRQHLDSVEQLFAEPNDAVSKSFVCKHPAAGIADARQGETTTTRMIYSVSRSMRH